MPRKKSSNKFIQSAIKRPGALTAKAKAAGVSIDEFAQRVRNNSKNYDPTTVSEVNLYLNVLKRGGKK